MSDHTLSTVRPDDTTVLTAIARRVLRGFAPDPSSTDHNHDRDVQRSAERLAGYLTSGELVIEVRLPDDDEPDDATLTVWLTFDDGLEPIIVPWRELDLDLSVLDRSARHDT